MTAYEKEVIKAFLNEAFGQMAAEVDGQTIIPGYFNTTKINHEKTETRTYPTETETTCRTEHHSGYFDTDSSYPKNLSEERFVTHKVSGYWRNRGYIVALLSTLIDRAGEIAVNNQYETEAIYRYYDGLLDMIMEQLDIFFKGE